jgi:hypothetical protein
MAKTPAQRIKKHGSKAAVPQHHLPPVVNPTTSRTPHKAENNGSLILIAGVVASLFLFWYLHLLTLDQMRQLTTGEMAMPDSLIGGFDPSYIGQLHAGMDDDARGQLNYVHKTAGTLFPLIFGFTWLLLIGTSVARKALRWALWALPLLFVVVRLWGNVAIDGVLASAAPDAGQVALASGLTVAGWVLLVLSLLAGAAAVLLRTRKPKTRES